MRAQAGGRWRASLAAVVLIGTVTSPPYLFAQTPAHFLPRTARAGPFLQAGRAGRVTFPRGAVIRTIVKELAPDAIDGPTLFHEHMSLSKGYWDQMLAGMAPEVRQRLAVPPGETYFLEDLDLIVREMRAAKQDGVGCLVDGRHADMGRS